MKVRDHLIRLIPVIVACVFLVLSSCKKKVVDAYLVVETTNISIPDESDTIKYVQFISSDTGFASTMNDCFYKTINGGLSWDKIVFGQNKIFYKIHFFSDSVGLILSSDAGYSTKNLFYTNDGGNSWTNKMKCKDFAVTENSIVIAIYESSTSNAIYKSNDFGFSFQNTGNIVGGSIGPIVLETANSMVLAYRPSDFDYDIRFYKEDGSSYDLVVSAIPLVGAILSFDNGEWVVFNNSGIHYCDFIEYGSDKYETYYIHDVSIKDGIAIGVGDNTIVTNYDKYVSSFSDDTWHEVLGTDGNGFYQDFYAIDQIESKLFFVGGTNGLIWRCRL